MTYCTTYTWECAAKSAAFAWETKTSWTAFAWKSATSWATYTIITITYTTSRFACYSAYCCCCGGAYIAGTIVAAARHLFVIFFYFINLLGIEFLKLLIIFIITSLIYFFS